MRWYIRLIAWLVAASLQSVLQERQKERSERSWLDVLSSNRSEEQQIDEELQRFAEEYFDLYIDFAILEERIEGNLPAFEGIRIVKERKPDG